jgi:hypothetical protein
MSAGKVVVRVEGARVLVNLDDRAFCEFEPKVAEEIGRALIDAAKRAAEIEHADRIALDCAILMRAGAPLTLSNNPRILDAARNTAAWDRDLRRYMPGIKSTEVFGLPTLLQEAAWQSK